MDVHRVVKLMWISERWVLRIGWRCNWSRIVCFIVCRPCWIFAFRNQRLYQLHIRNIAQNFYVLRFSVFKISVKTPAWPSSFLKKKDLCVFVLLTFIHSWELGQRDGKNAFMAWCSDKAQGQLLPSIFNQASLPLELLQLIILQYNINHKSYRKVRNLSLRNKQSPVILSTSCKVHMTCDSSNNGFESRLKNGFMSVFL
jgi:hypothetical protein